MQQETDILGIIKELRETSTRMTDLTVMLETNLAALQEKANKYDQLKLTLRGLIGEEGHAPANPNLASQQPSGRPETDHETPVKPEAVKPEAVKPEAVKPEAVKPEAVKPEAVKPEAVKPEGAHWTNEIRNLQDKNDRRKQILDIYETNGCNTVWIAEPMTKWEPEKVDAVYDNIDIHPDSFTPTGECIARPWTWEQVTYIIKNLAAVDMQTMEDETCHTVQDIQYFLKTIGIKTTPTANTNRNNKSLERMLPPYAQNPSPNQRLRIFRLMRKISPEQLIADTGFKPGTIQQIETGKKTMDATYANKLADKMGIPRDALKNMPITEMLSLDETQDAKTRLRVLRLRLAMDEAEAAKKAGYSEDDYQTLELVDMDAQSAKSKLKFICRAFGASADLFNDLFERTEQVDTMDMSTGEKILAAMRAANLTQRQLAKLAKVSESAISRHINEESNPQEETLAKIANALHLAPATILGAYNTKGKPIKTV